MCREENHIHAQTTAGAALHPQWKLTQQFASNNEDACPFNKRNGVKHDRDTAWIEQCDSFHSCMLILLSSVGWQESSWWLSANGSEHITFAFNTVEMQLAGSPFMQKKELYSLLNLYLVGARATDRNKRVQCHTTKLFLIPIDAQASPDQLPPFSSHEHLILSLHLFLAPPLFLLVWRTHPSLR